MEDLWHMWKTVLGDCLTMTQIYSDYINIYL